MCEWNNTKIIDIDGKSVSVDSCLVPIVKALNGGGIKTVACCCGHNKRPGSIILFDDSWLIVTNRIIAEKFFSNFPPINPI
jgi:hypothetical protein